MCNGKAPEGTTLKDGMCDVCYGERINDYRAAQMSAAKAAKIPDPPVLATGQTAHRLAQLNIAQRNASALLVFGVMLVSLSLLFVLADAFGLAFLMLMGGCGLMLGSVVRIFYIQGERAIEYRNRVETTNKPPPH